MESDLKERTSMLIDSGVPRFLRFCLTLRRQKQVVFQPPYNIFLPLFRESLQLIERRTRVGERRRPRHTAEHSCWNKKPCLARIDRYLN